MVQAVMRALQFDVKKSINTARNILFQANFLQEVVKKLDEDPTPVLNDLNAFRAAREYESNAQRLRLLNSISYSLPSW